MSTGSGAQEVQSVMATGSLPSYLVRSDKSHGSEDAGQQLIGETVAVFGSLKLTVTQFIKELNTKRIEM